MKPFFNAVGLGVMLMLAAASPSLAKAKKAAAPVDNSPVVTPDTTPPPVGTAAPTGVVQIVAPGSGPTAAPVPQGPPEPPVMLRAEQCLRVNVERVVRAEPSAKLATDLLLVDVCADEVDAASLYIRNVEALSHFSPESERGRAGLSMPHVDLETGQIVSPPNVDVSSALAADAAGRSGANQIAPNLRKYAAELVLNEKARLAAPTPRATASPKKSH
jgi:hypothetical protein